MLLITFRKDIVPLQWGVGSHGGIYTAAAPYRQGSGSLIGGAVAHWFIGFPAGLGDRVNGAV